MPRVLITTVPFGEVDPISLRVLEDAGLEYFLNPIGRRLTDDELASLVQGFDCLIAGTEPITDQVMAAEPRLRLISRGGVGLDNVDLTAARTRGVEVSYTPEGPADAVAELTIGLSLSLLRSVHIANRAIRTGVWKRIQGRRLEKVTVGVVGVGRIGTRVIRLLSALGGEILANDLSPVTLDQAVRWVDKETLFREADVVTLHVPLTRHTRNLIGADELEVMGAETLLVNTCRGGVVNEAALADALRRGVIAGAAVDTFAEEPYHGELVEVETCLITPHMGSMSADCRLAMEVGAARNVVAFLAGKPLDETVPDTEYEMRAADEEVG